MAEAAAWMPLYIGDYLADTMHLTGPQHGAYLLLIMHYWRTGPLMDDDAELASIARTERKVWASEVGPTIRRFFSFADGRLHHKRIDREMTKAMQNSSKRRDAANARWKQTECNPDANGYANASSLQSKRNDPRGREPSPSPSEEKENTLRVQKKADPRRKPRTTIDPAWKPDAAGIRYADERGVTPNELNSFRDYHLAHGTLVASCDAWWRRWCDKAVEFGRAPGKPSADETRDLPLLGVSV